MKRQEEKQKLMIPLQKHVSLSQEETDDLVVEIIAEAIRNMRKSKPKKN